MQNTDRKFFLVCLIFLAYTIIILVIFKTNRLPSKIVKVSSNMVNDNKDLFSELPSLYYGFLHGRWRGISADEKAKLSELGKILFLDEDPPLVEYEQKEYVILIWKYGQKLKKRHVMRYTKKSYDPFENCSVKNCVVKYANSYLATADLVIFDLHHIKSANELPLDSKYNPKQIWAFLSDHSPPYTFQNITSGTSDFDELFNWAMTYRMDSDIPVPYGRTELLRNTQKHLEIDYEEWNKSKYQDVLLATVISNCQGKNSRWDYIKELQKHLKIDIYGKCGNRKCKADVKSLTESIPVDCEETINYKFYLAFENSNCDEYITEKVWWYSYSKNAIPIVMGGSQAYYEQLLPPHSYLNTERFARPRDLANYVMYLNRTPSDIQQYFVWKKYFKVINEHGYFHSPSQHYCRACEALNYNKKGKIIHNLEEYWSKGKCHSDWKSSNNNTKHNSIQFFS